MKKILFVSGAFLIVLTCIIFAKYYFDNQKLLNECNEKLYSMKKDAIIMKNCGTLILADYSFSLEQFWKNGKSWGGIAIPDSVSSIDIPKLEGYIVSPESIKDCLSNRKFQYGLDGSLKKFENMHKKFQADLQFVKEKKKESFKDICDKYDTLNESLTIVKNDIFDPLPNPFAGALWGEHLQALDDNIKKINDIKMKESENEMMLESTNMFKFMHHYHMMDRAYNGNGF